MTPLKFRWSRDSSVSIVSGYGLDDRAIEARSQAGAKDFSSILCVQISSETHPTSYTTGIEGSFLGGKARQGRDADHSPHLVPSSWMSRSYTSSPPNAFILCSETALLKFCTRKFGCRVLFEGIQCEYRLLKMFISWEANKLKVWNKQPLLFYRAVYSLLPQGKFIWYVFQINFLPTKFSLLGCAAV
jgi:hypothetical protein